LGFITYLLKHGGVFLALPKPTRKPIPSLRYFVIKHGGSMLLKGYVHVPKTVQYTCNTLHRVSQKYIGFHNIFFETLKGIA
jgi:hypothetical protein